MNWRVALVMVLGTAAMTALLFHPPWQSEHGYAGHHNLFRTMMMTVDGTRLLIEEGLILGVTVVAAWRLRTPWRTRIKAPQPPG